jgi:hypothetical protein
VLVHFCRFLLIRNPSKLQCCRLERIVSVMLISGLGTMKRWDYTCNIEETKAMHERIRTLCRNFTGGARRISQKDDDDEKDSLQNEAFMVTTLMKSFSRYLMEFVNNMHDNKRMEEELIALDACRHNMRARLTVSQLVQAFERYASKCWIEAKRCHSYIPITPSWSMSIHACINPTALSMHQGYNLLENEAFATQSCTFLRRACVLLPDAITSVRSATCDSMASQILCSFFDPSLNPAEYSGWWFVNPPFTETILLKAAEKIVASNVSFLFVCPNWKDCAAFKYLSAVQGVTKDKISDFLIPPVESTDCAECSSSSLSSPSLPSTRKRIQVDCILFSRTCGNEPSP